MEENRPEGHTTAPVRVDAPARSLMLTDEQQDLIERFGVLHDQLGHSPATGRIIGLLLVSPRPELTFDEIREALSLSKSSTSAGLNLLLSIGSITYSTHPGERKRYFSKNYDDWERTLLDRMDTFLALKDLLREAHDLKTDGPVAPGPEIPRMIDFLEFIKSAVHDAAQKWTSARDAGVENTHLLDTRVESGSHAIHPPTPTQGDENQ